MDWGLNVMYEFGGLVFKGLTQTPSDIATRLGTGNPCGYRHI